MCLQGIIQNLMGSCCQTYPNSVWLVLHRCFKFSREYGVFQGWVAVSPVHCIFLNQLLFLYCYTHSYPDNRMLGVWYKDVRVFCLFQCEWFHFYGWYYVLEKQWGTPSPCSFCCHWLSPSAAEQWHLKTLLVFVFLPLSILSPTGYVLILFPHPICFIHVHVGNS